MSEGHFIAKGKIGPATKKESRVCRGKDSVKYDEKEHFAYLRD